MISACLRTCRRSCKYQASHHGYLYSGTGYLAVWCGMLAQLQQIPKPFGLACSHCPLYVPHDQPCATETCDTYGPRLPPGHTETLKKFCVFPLEIFGFPLEIFGFPLEIFGFFGIFVIFLSFFGIFWDFFFPIEIFGVLFGPGNLFFAKYPCVWGHRLLQ